MRQDFESGVFGTEKDGSFQSAVTQIIKGFGEEDFYPSLEEKAATLLYFIVKNHGFVDGSKPIAAACFLLFLKKKLLHNGEGKPFMSSVGIPGIGLYFIKYLDSNSRNLPVPKQRSFNRPTEPKKVYETNEPP